MNQKICIVGAGWYGCHLGLYLKEKGYTVKIFEKGKIYLRDRQEEINLDFIKDSIIPGHH